MIFTEITKSSLLDYPGKISIVLYTPRCNYNCLYCHNRRLIEDIDNIIPNEEIIKSLEKRIGLINTIVVTGGESTFCNDLIPF